MPGTGPSAQDTTTANRVRSLTKTLLTGVCLVLIFGSALRGVPAQMPRRITSKNQIVKLVRFEVDKQEVHEDFSILLYGNGETIEPKRLNGGFIVPEKFKNLEEVGVRFVSNRYHLEFGPVYHTKFDGKWTVGVDTAPFDSEHVTKREAKNLKMLYYLEFMPSDGEGTVMVVRIPKSEPKTRKRSVASLISFWRLF